MKSFPFITAHTGCMGTPDNTLRSVEMALKHGADVVEDDIRITRDGVLVLAHDDAVSLPDGTRYSISRITYAELSELDVVAHNGAPGETIRIAKLEPALTLIQAAGKIMNLDLKSDDCVEPVSRLVEKNGLLDRVFLSGCETGRARIVQQVNPRLRKLLNAEHLLFQTLPYSEAVKQTCEDAISAACLGININYRAVAPELLEAAAGHRLAVYVWTVDEEAEMRRFLTDGVHSITTRNVAALARLRQEIVE